MKRITGIALLVCVCVICACGNSVNNEISVSKVYKETETNASYNTADMNESRHIKKELLEGVVVDADVICPESADQVSVLTCKCSIYNGKELAEKLFPEIPENEWQEQDYSSIGVDPGMMYIGDIKLDDQSEESGSIILGFNLAFYTYHWKNCSSMFPGIQNDVDKQAYDFDLSFASRDEIRENAEEYLRNKVGVSDFAFLKGYSIKHEMMEERYQEYLKEVEAAPDEKKDVESTKLKESWDEQDDCYYLIFEKKLMGIPILNTPYARQDEISLPNGIIEAGYTARGMEYLQVRTDYEILEERPSEWIGAEEALSVIKNKFELSFSNDIEIDELKLIYFPFPKSEMFEYEFIPAWEIHYRETSQDKIITGYIYINAVTGTEITE